MRFPLALICCLACTGTVAAETDTRQGFWGNIDVGIANLYLAADGANNRSASHVTFALAGGYTVHPQFQLGVEAARLNIESGTLWNPLDGEGITTLFAVARIWPTRDAKLFLKLAGGNVTHWDDDTGASAGDGHGYTVGVGYELMRYAGRETYLFLNYSRGNISDYAPDGGSQRDEDFRVMAAGLSFGF